MQVYSIRTPADLALLWKNSHLNNLDHFLLQSNSKQLALLSIYSDIQSKIKSDVSTPSNTSRQVLNPSGKILIMKTAEGSFFLSIKLKKTKIKYIQT